MRTLTLSVALLCLSTGLSAYSVLTHQAIVDAAWEKSLLPLLKQRFPDASQDDVRSAHAYAYGGCIIQDMGYYPFGSKFFSDLLHYVRSADFVENLIDESHDLNEYAFSLGALAHYASDNIGHPVAVNRSVAILYPKLGARYGDEVTYEDNPTAHLKAEFGFDVVQVARGHYAPESYHDFIGFEVSKPVLERAFLKTYGLELKDVILSVDLALGSYRHAVSTIIPEMTKVAWDLKKDDLVKAEPGLTREKFLYNLSQSAYEKEWGREYHRPGPFAKVLAFILRIIPRFGPFKSLSFKPPTPETEKLFMASFNRTLDRYRTLLSEVRAGNLRIVNRDFDTGDPTRPGEYRLADETYAKLVDKLADDEFASIPEPLAQNILAFYKNPDAPIATKADKCKWRKLTQQLAQLRAKFAGKAAA